LPLTLSLSIVGSSCCTELLTDNIKPDEPVWIPASVATEAELREKGVPYTKYDSDDLHGYLVKKSSMRRLGEYTLLTLATPLTLTVDTAVVVVRLAVGLNPILGPAIGVIRLR
jgi:hypothetical protein